VAEVVLNEGKQVRMELRNIYKNIGTNYEIILERFCNDEGMLGTFVMSFPGDPTYQRLTKAVEELEYGEVENQAHALKGVAANLGFDKLQAACSDMVLSVRKNKYESIGENYKAVKNEYENVVREIQDAR